MRFFDHFPPDKKCPICGTNEDKACTLIPIDGTEKDTICEAEIIHKACVETCHKELRFNKELGIIYMRVR